MSNDDGDERESRPTAHERVRAMLRQSILRGDLSGGTRLVQTELAKELQVSTTPIREALRDLATEGLIVLDRHRGGIVRRLTKAEMDEIALIRSLLEPTAIRLAIERISDAELETAEELCDAMAQEQDIGEWLELNRRFHYVFHDATRLPRMAEYLRRLQDSASVFVGQVFSTTPRLLRKSNGQHRELIDAARQRDSERAVEIQSDHVVLHIAQPPTP